MILTIDSDAVMISTVHEDDQDVVHFTFGKNEHTLRIRADHVKEMYTICHHGASLQLEVSE